MHAIQTSGNCIRNITSDHLAGVTPDELEDPRPWCEIIRQWSTFHPEFTYLPRKFKIAVTGAPQDRAASLVHDVGVHIVRGPNGESGLRDSGRRRPGPHADHRPGGAGFPAARAFAVLSEAILRVYNLEGRRDNLHKARIKILVRSLGIEEFRRRVEAEWQLLRDSGLRIDDAEIARMRRLFQSARLPRAARMAPDGRQENRPFALGTATTPPRTRSPGYRAVYISLKNPDVAPGDITDVQMDLVADLADRYSFGEVRVMSHPEFAARATSSRAGPTSCGSSSKRPDSQHPTSAR